MLSVNAFTLSSKNKILIKDLSFKIDNGQVLSIMGPSGIGKSSLLHFLSGSLSPNLLTSGEAFLNNETLHTKSIQERKVGLLQQMPLLFPHMSIIENLLFAIPTDINKLERIAMAESALKKLDIPDKASALPKELSGGQQARVALLRTLLARPDYLLLDEPFSKLDPALRRDVRAFVLNEIRQANIPALLVTHDSEDAKAMEGKCLELGIVK
ncbi:ATP-binding cassette domain-containing protein [Marinomonas rhizomae]|uniref:Putative thiamine transport system ATP-binding protein n=1 Tax=Marinomonas rhizomae TaxID=491948 RepID=A0A366IWI4_9GAMM|nr:ATP-binding cassette domain-containing protein [Marinomonas rhizomae]RBP79166.1 putative thiamine transport system ATP-binding protein [Marinomonas rhizomae]RNF70456.1 ATP-binding cassette domain-containing protein [Marinomonas rhizomae]